MRLQISISNTKQRNLHFIPGSSWPIRTISFSFDGEFIASASEDLAIDIVSIRHEPIVCSASSVVFETDFFCYTPTFVVVGGVGRDSTQDRLLCSHEYSCMASQQIPARLCRRRTGVPSGRRRNRHGWQPPCLWLQRITWI